VTGIPQPSHRPRHRRASRVSGPVEAEQHQAACRERVRRSVTHMTAASRAHIGDLIVVITLAGGVSAQIAGVLQLVSYLHSAAATVDRIMKIRRASPPAQRPVTSAARVPETLTSGIGLEHPSFSYRGSAEPVIDNVSCSRISSSSSSPSGRASGSAG
jgi:ABC-type multidrug transport system fused ATPase/permease subunit